jgi:hypothetical protein
MEIENWMETMELREITGLEIIWLLLTSDSHGEEVIRIPTNWIASRYWLSIMSRFFVL